MTTVAVAPLTLSIWTEVAKIDQGTPEGASLMAAAIEAAFNKKYNEEFYPARGRVFALRPIRRDSVSKRSLESQAEYGLAIAKLCMDHARTGDDVDAVMNRLRLAGREILTECFSSPRRDGLLLMDIAKAFFGNSGSGWCRICNVWWFTSVLDAVNFAMMRGEFRDVWCKTWLEIAALNEAADDQCTKRAFRAICDIRRNADATKFDPLPTEDTKQLIEAIRSAEPPASIAAWAAEVKKLLPPAAQQ